MNILKKSVKESTEKDTQEPNPRIIINGEGLSIEDIVKVAVDHHLVQISDDPQTLEAIRRSKEFIMDAVKKGDSIYGVNTGYGGMAHLTIPLEECTEHQNNLLMFLKAGAGKYLPEDYVRAAMLLRANSLVRGVSGIRIDLIERLIIFLNEGVTPLVREFGSIGASGDLVPLSAIAGAITGQNKSFRVIIKGQETDSISALSMLGLKPMDLDPKEGLALVNGTSFMAGGACLAIHESRNLLSLSMGVHALLLQGLGANTQMLHPFIHSHKKHPGQWFSADQMLHLLHESKLTRNELDGHHTSDGQGDIQDRYSIRCLPQYMGPIVDGLAIISRQMETEANSSTDNPLIDIKNNTSYHGANFLGQYVAAGMDQLRYHLGLLAKHIDVQIAVVTSPEFSQGLPPSLVGNESKKTNAGLKGLQISGNSIMPLISYYGNPLADRFPTHAEQYNQNINSLGFGSVHLTQQSLEAFKQYMAIALMFSVQAVDLKTFTRFGHYNAEEVISPDSAKLYRAVLQVLNKKPSREKPYIYNDSDQDFSQHIALIYEDINANKITPNSMKSVYQDLANHRPLHPGYLKPGALPKNRF